MEKIVLNKYNGFVKRVEIKQSKAHDRNGYFEFVDELPMTITGKPQKFIMRDKMIEMLSTKISN